MEQRKLLERELDILRDRLLLMGGEAELAIQRAMHALVQRDSDVANQVLEHDTVIDRLELEIDRLSVEGQGLPQPLQIVNDEVAALLREQPGLLPCLDLGGGGRALSRDGAGPRGAEAAAGGRGDPGARAGAREPRGRAHGIRRLTRTR